MADNSRPPSATLHPAAAGIEGRRSVDGSRQASVGQSSGIAISEDAASSTSLNRERPVRETPETKSTADLRTPGSGRASGQGQMRDGADAGGDSSKKMWNFVPLPIRRAGTAIAAWAKGPPEPRRYKIKPLFPKVQEFPIRLLERLLPRLWQKALLTLVYLAMWATAFAMVIRLGQQVTEVEGYGVPTSIDCGVAFWARNNGCGIDGMYCRPFNGSGFAFRCPANCQSYRVLNPRAVGDQVVNYRPFVIGGPPDAGGSSADAVYRGDSHVCSSAIHAGVVSNTAGGCGLLVLTGQQNGFVASDRNGISSIGFDTTFPLSFRFQNSVECHARDLRWPLLGLSVAFSAVFSLFVSSAPLFFFVTFTALFWHVGMVSDPPRHSSMAELASIILGKYLPAMIVAWLMFDKMGVRRTLAGLTALVEKTVLWLGGCWLGALENYSFEEWIPITRLTGRDLEQQPGAKAALALIIVVLVVVFVFQVYFFRQEGRLLRHLQLYLLFLVGILICLAMPGLQLRIHHYILGLLLLPGTSVQTRPSLLFQGLLVGLFINGIARWGFDSLLQTAAALQGDGQYNSALPSIMEPAIALASNLTAGSGGSGGISGNLSTITFSWEVPPLGASEDGISILVNDVERYRGFFRDGDTAGGGDPNTNGRRFEWSRRAGEDINEYFRFGYIVGTSNLDYTRAGTWDKQGKWVPMAAGPSRAVRRGGGFGVHTDADVRGLDEDLTVRAWLKRRRGVLKSHTP